MDAAGGWKGTFFKDASCIASNMVNFKCICFGSIVILDSNAHLKSSLGSLIKRIPDHKKIMFNDEHKLSLNC